MKETMILTAHQPVYLPWLGLFHKINLADQFVYFDDVQYQKRDWNNRNKIKTKDGTPWLTVPVYSKNHFETKLKDIRINNELPWRKKHFNTICQAYKNAPYFQLYIGVLEKFYNQPWEKLSDLNEQMLKQFLQWLGINVPVLKLSDLNLKSQKSDLVLDMCRSLKADVYLFGAQGKNYAEKSAFQKQGIQVYFQDYQHPVYSQLHNKTFDPYMSVLDLLFNCGEKSLEIINSGNPAKRELRERYFQKVSL